MEVCRECKDPTSEEVESGEERREVSKECASVKSVGGLRKRHGGRNLAADRLYKPKERTLGNCGSRKRLAITGRKMTHRTGVARPKGYGRQGQG
jgi:hypothetical protein